MDRYRYVILGGGVTAGYAAEEFAERGIEPEELCIVAAEDRPPYDRPPLSKEVLQGKEGSRDALIERASFYDDHGIRLFTGTPVIGVDLERRSLYAEGGAQIGYEDLLIATGSRLRKLDVPGAHLEGIHYLRTAGDADAILEDVDDARRAVVIGGGFIGTEVGASLRQQGLDVTLVYRERRLLEDQPLTPRMSTLYEKLFKDHGVELRPERSVAGFDGRDHLRAVRLDDGERLDIDLVVAGIGVEPEVSIFEDGPLAVGDGILVNEYLETGIPHVHAAGDVARYYDVLYERRRRIEHWDNAEQQGRHFARLMTGPRRPFVHVPYFFSDAFDLSWEFWGDTEGARSVVYRGDVGTGSFSAWWLADRRVVAAFVMERPEDEREAAENLIKSGRPVSANRLEDERTELLELARVAA